MNNHKKNNLIRLNGSLLMLFIFFTVSFYTGSFMGLNAQESPQGNVIVNDKVESVPDVLQTGFNSISGRDAEIYLQFLASDALEGREAGSRGFAAASEYVLTLFRTWGILPAGEIQGDQRSFFQPVEYRKILGTSSSIKVSHTVGQLVRSWTFNSAKDYVFYPSTYPGERATLAAPVVFVGYGMTEKGLNYDDYRSLDVKGKIVMVLTGVPGENNPNSPFNKGDFKEKYMTGQVSEDRMFEQIALAKEKGAVAVILVENNPVQVYREKLNALKPNDEKPAYSSEARPMMALDASFNELAADAPYIRISREMANIIAGYSGKTVESLKDKIDQSFMPNSTPFPGVVMEIESKVQTELAGCNNILGTIEGSDPKLKDEVVIIGAHLDHLGKQENYIYNGADDNGSGCSALLEVAQAFALNPIKPKRTIVFAFWTGEEWNYIGSNYYAKHPLFPLNQTVAYLNLDMLSREWTWESFRLMMADYHGIELPEPKPENLDFSIFLPWEMSKTPKLEEIMKKSAACTGMNTYLIKVSEIIQSSDNLSFATHEIPWINSFGGETKDYHSPLDTVDKVSWTLIEKAARFMYLTAFSISDSGL